MLKKFLAALATDDLVQFSIGAAMATAGGAILVGWGGALVALGALLALSAIRGST